MKLSNAKIRTSIAGFTLVFLTGCSINLVSDYDEILDKGTLDLASMTGSVFGKLRECAYKGKGICPDPSTTYDPKDYSAIRNKLDVMIVRSTSDIRNSGTTAELYRVGEAILLDPPVQIKKYTPVASGREEESDPPISPLNSLEGRNSRNDEIDIQTIQLAQELINMHFRAIMATQRARKTGEKAEAK